MIKKTLLYAAYVFEEIMQNIYKKFFLDEYNIQ